MLAAASDPVAHVALGLALLLVAAKVGGHLAARFGQIAVLGELLAGVVLGNLPGPAARWLRDDPSLDLFARVGALVLLFDVGLELTVREVWRVGRPALFVALLGTAASLACGGLASLALDPSAAPVTHILLGAALTATSVGITARVLKDLGETRSDEARIVLAAAVIDDVLGLVVLTLVSGSIAAAGALGRPSPRAVAAVVGKTAGFFALAVGLGGLLVPRLFALAARLRASGAQVAVGLALCFSLAWCANAIGLAPILGAFTAGLLLEEPHSAGFVARGERPLRELVEPVASFLVPVFFVLMGARVDLRALASPSALAVALALTGAAVVGKLACALGASGVRRLPVALGMLPRGEVTLVYASLGGSLRIEGAPALAPPLYSALVLVVLVTTLLTPPALRWAFGRSARI